MFYFILGGLTVGLQLFVQHLLSKTGKAGIWPGVLTLSANAFLMLGLAWMYASVLEHEMQAAMLGLIVFGGTGVIIGIATYRIISAKPAQR
jgi:hypothetical protein